VPIANAIKADPRIAFIRISYPMYAGEINPSEEIRTADYYKNWM